MIKYYSKGTAGIQLPLGDTDLRLLRVFRAVVECGGVSAAQETLGIGRSTISVRLSALETRLNVRLCERGRKGFRLTEEGKVIYVAILDLWRAAEHFKDRAASVQEGLMGELSICTLDHAVTDPNNPVPEAVDRFKRRSDSVTVSIGVAPPLEVERAVREGRAHVGISEPFLVLPNTSSERREYIPIGWLTPDVVANQKLRILPDATLANFALLTSAMHMAWMRTVTGRMKSDYMYSVGVVYNTFPTPPGFVDGSANLSRLEPFAQAVLDGAYHPGATLADLYDPDTMSPNLRRAHQTLDRAVERLYRRARFASERERVEHLFALL